MKLVPAPLPRYRYLARYKRRLVALIGLQAADIVGGVFRWCLGALVCMILGATFAIVADPGSSSAGLAAVALSLVLLACCGGRALALSIRGGRAASNHLSEELGHRVDIPVAKVSLRWWRERIADERPRHPSPPTT